MADSTARKLAQLKRLSDEAGSNLFTRIKLASEVLSDADWIATAFNGDDVVAHDYVQHEYFANLARLMPVGRMVAIYRHFSDESKWRELRYDVVALEIVWKDEIRASEEEENKAKRNTTRWKSETAKAIEEKRLVEAEAKRFKSIAETQEAELKTVREQAAEAVKLAQEKRRADAESKQWRSVSESQQDEIQRLRSRIRELEDENAGLRDKVSDLQRQLAQTAMVEAA